jgi:hypothetical protein
MALRKAISPAVLGITLLVVGVLLGGVVVYATLTVGKQTQTVSTTLNSVYTSVVATTYTTTFTSTNSQNGVFTSTVTATQTATYTVTTLKTIPYPVPPFLRSSSWGFASNSQAVTCTLNNVATGDELLIVVQSAGVSQLGTTLSAFDNSQDIFSYYTRWNQGWGMGAAFTSTGGSGTVKLTLQVANGGAGLSTFCYDIVGTQNSVSIFYGSGAGRNLTVGLLTVPVKSFVVGFYLSTGTAASFSPGLGYTLANGTTIASAAGTYIGSEYAVEGPGSATCPMTTDASQTWAGMCFVVPVR